MKDGDRKKIKRNSEALPLVSVVVPVYNVKKYLEKCLESLLSQSYEKIEILVVDDGSTDGSGKLCDQFAKRDKRIKVFHKKNGGLSDARNYGIKIANGKYVCFVDSDDYVKKTYVEKLYKAISENKADIAVCGFEQIVCDEGNKKSEVVPTARVRTGKEATIEFLTGDFNLVAWNKMYLKELFVKNEIWYPVGKIHEDNLTTYKLISKAKKVVFFSDALYVYITKRKGSITQQSSREKSLKTFEQMAKEAIRYLQDDEEMKSAAEVALMIAHCYWRDAALAGEVREKYLKRSRLWLKINMARCRENKCINDWLMQFAKKDLDEDNSTDDLICRIVWRARHIKAKIARRIR